jgi:hypothetical protein
MDQNTTDITAEGRWAAAAPAAPPRRPYEPPSLRQLKTKEIFQQSQLEQGYEVVDGDGRPQRRDYVVLGWVVKDPDDG